MSVRNNQVRRLTPAGRLAMVAIVAAIAFIAVIMLIPTRFGFGAELVKQNGPPTAATVTSCLVPGCDGEGFIAAAIDGARSELRLQFYNFTSAPIGAAIVRAKARGVDVALLLDKISPCQKGSQAEAVLAAGIPIKIDRLVRIAHNKVAVIDAASVIEGSFNASAAAMHNAENTNLVESPAIAALYRDQWQRRAQVSTAYAGRAASCHAKVKRARSAARSAR